MMKIIKVFLFSLVVISISSCAFMKSSSFNKYKTQKDIELKHGTWLEAIDSNKVLMVRYVDGKKEGKAKIFYPSGEYETLNYNNDKLDGLLKHYMKDGLLCYEVIYKDGKVIETKRYCGLKW